jgi:hypothetical protein
MGMKIPSALGRLPRTGRSVAEARHNIVPEHIRLPDGRRIAVADLVRKSANRQHHNLLNGKTTGTRVAKSIDTDVEE